MKQNSDNRLMTELLNLYQASEHAEKLTPETVSPDPIKASKLVREAFLDFEASLEEAKTQAQETGQIVKLDGSKLSGTKAGGDFWLVHPDGSYNREYKPFPDINDLIETRRSERVAEPNKAVSLETVYEIIRLAQRSPNATNEQPTRVIVYPQDHPSMNKIGSAMTEVLNELLIPKISLKNYILNQKKSNPDFLANYKLAQLEKMNDEEIQQFENHPVPLNELPKTKNNMMNRGRLFEEDGKFYKCRERKGQVIKKGEYTLKDLIQDDSLFTQGMGRFFLEFKNTHPVLLIILRKIRYSSIITETLEKYYIKIPDIGEAFLDAGIFTDHLALITRAFGLSGIIKTGPLNIAADKITNILIQDLSQQSDRIKQLIQQKDSDNQQLEQEYHKLTYLQEGLKIGLEAYYAKYNHKKLDPATKKQISMGNGYFPATFFQIGHPLSDPGERVMDPKQGRQPLVNMTVYMSPE